jgi:predicted AlkP superfamily phosphohydrolase/phosphomutase
MTGRFPKVIILGADGMDPEFVEPWLAEGKLPNLAKIKAQGFYSRLGTTNPAESPVAWSSFISGKNPGKHGIFDFLSRDAATYLPHLAAMTVVQKRFGKPLIISNREGGAFWDHLGKAGCPPLHCRFRSPSRPPPSVAS